jgi:bacterioferritin-associated ferredoxin
MSRDSNSVWEGGAVCEEKPKDLILLACFEVVYDSRSDTMLSQYFPASVQNLEFVFNTATHCKDCDNAARQCLKSLHAACYFVRLWQDRGQKLESVFNTATHCKDCDNAARQCLKSLHAACSFVRLWQDRGQKLEFVFNTATHCKDCDNAARQCLKSHMIESSSSLYLFFCSTLAGSRRAN